MRLGNVMTLNKNWQNIIIISQKFETYIDYEIAKNVIVLSSWNSDKIKKKKINVSDWMSTTVKPYTIFIFIFSFFFSI